MTVVTPATRPLPPPLLLLLLQRLDAATNVVNSFIGFRHGNVSKDAMFFTNYFTSNSNIPVA